MVACYYILRFCYPPSFSSSLNKPRGPQALRSRPEKEYRPRAERGEENNSVNGKFVFPSLIVTPGSFRVVVDK